MKHDVILINGDSYSAPNDNHKVYGDFLAEYLDIPVRNFAKPGSNNKRIQRTTIEYLFEVKKEFKNPMVIIGWSLVRRQEVWYYGKNPKILKYIHDDPESRLVTLDHLINANEATLEHKAMILPDMHIHKALTDFYTDIFLLSNYLKYNQCDFFFLSAADNTDCPINCFPYLQSLTQVEQVTNDNNIFQLHEFCVRHWAKENDPDCLPVTGHLSESGHKKFATLLLDKLPIDR